MITDISTESINTIERIIKPQISINKLEYSSSTYKMFSLLFNRIAHSRELWNINKNNINYSVINDLSYDTNYYPTPIQKYINENKKTIYKSSFVCGEHSINLFIMNYNSVNKRTFIMNIIKKVYTWLMCASNFSSSKCSQNLNIYLSLTNQIKKLPNLKDKYIDREHINSAFTYSCKKDNEIHIFRNEEWFKVLIHESFHSLGLDFSVFDHTDSNKQILELFNVKSDVRIFETYCEVWAEIINCMFIVLSNTHWNDNYDKWLENLNNKLIELLHNERIFSLFQCSKILSYFKMNYNDLFENNDKYKEKTHILSYFIIKSIFLFHLDDYIQKCIEINGYTINFKKQDYLENINNYILFVKETYKNKAYIETINQITHITNKNNTKISNNVKNTLRMSLYNYK